MTLPNTLNKYQDNRLDYFFDHPDQFLASNAIGVAFGAAFSNCTRASTDGGHLLARATAYYQSGGAAACTP